MELMGDGLIAFLAASFAGRGAGIFKKRIKYRIFYLLFKRDHIPYNQA